MSTYTTSPSVPVDEETIVETSAETYPGPTGDDLPFESPEFGVGQFFPHLDAPTDG